MNISDLISRTEFVAKKYEKYTAVTESKAPKSADPFTQLFSDLLQRTNELNLKAEEIANEKNRANKAVLNAEQRKNKSTLLDIEVPNLQKLVRKGKTTPEIIADRERKVYELKQAIEGIADGVHGARKPGRMNPLGTPTLGITKGKQGIEINIAEGLNHRTNNEDYYSQTDATRAFQQEFEVAKKRQDKALDNIEKGVSTLKGIGEAMGETVRQQDVLLDAIDERMDIAIKELKTNNMKLKGLVTQMRSSRNFCIDIVLLMIILGVALYVYNLIKKK